MIQRTLAASMLVVATLGGVGGCAWLNDKFSDRQTTGGQALDDRTITSRVKDRIGDDRSIDSSRINVETLKGTVQLAGFVATQAEKERAVKIARDVPDVKSVRDNIIVQPAR